MVKCLITAFLLLAISGCGSKPVAAENGPYFTTSDGALEFQFPPGWFQNPKEHPFELQCFSKDESLATGVFVFKRSELAKDASPQNIFDLQIDDVRRKRENFRIFEELQSASVAGKALTTIVYLGEKGSSRNYYKFTLIEFTENPEVFAVLVQTAVPEKWEKGQQDLVDILKSARLRS